MTASLKGQANTLLPLLLPGAAFGVEVLISFHGRAIIHAEFLFALHEMWRSEHRSEDISSEEIPPRSV